jgi:lipopolysaccharide assembly protein A
LHGVVDYAGRGLACMKLLFWIVVGLVAVALASFAASNRESVAIGLWPLPFAADLPLYLAVLGALLIGVILGAVAAWTAGRGKRREARRRGRRIAALERELAATRAPLPAAIEPPPPALAARG